MYEIYYYDYHAKQYFGFTTSSRYQAKEIYMRFEIVVGSHNVGTNLMFFYLDEKTGERYPLTRTADKMDSIDEQNYFEWYSYRM